MKIHHTAHLEKERYLSAKIPISVYIEECRHVALIRTDVSEELSPPSSGGNMFL
jgi:hypothetical protein